PTDRRATRNGGVQVRPGDLRGQTRAPDQLLLRPAQRRPPRTRRPTGRRREPGETVVDRHAGDQGGCPERHPTGQDGLTPLRIVLGVSGGIAAYKAVALLRLLREAGHEVRVLPTASALKFVGAPTWEALAAHPVSEDVFHGTDTVDH